MITAKTTCSDKSDTEIASLLLQAVSDQHYIPDATGDSYAQALLRQYKIEQNIPVAPEPAQGLRIYVLGQGCARCSQMENDLRDILSEMQIAADLRHITEHQENNPFRYYRAPALVINDKVVSTGSVPPKSQLRQWIIRTCTD